MLPGIKETQEGGHYLTLAFACYCSYTAQYREYSDGVKAMQHWNGKKLAGREIQVSIAALPTVLPMVLPPMLPPELMGMDAAAVQQMYALHGRA